MSIKQLTLLVRTLRKHGTITLLNIFGLGIGFSSALIILAFIQHEVAFDTHHRNGERIYRITEEVKGESRQIHSAKNHSPMAELLRDNVPSIKNVIRIYPYPAYIKGPDEKYKEPGIVFADSAIFQTFTMKEMQGKLAEALNAPFNVVITSSIATKYFGTSNPIGQPLTFEDERGAYTFHVAAVIGDLPANSHFNFDVIFPIASLRTIMPWFNRWFYPPMYIYAETHQPVDIVSFEQSIQVVAVQHQPPHVREENRMYHAQKLHDIHLTSHLDDEWQANSNVWSLQLFGGIAIFLIVLASINFINLSTSQTAKRVREVGVRKVLGAVRFQLIRQFLCESMLVTSFAALLALGLAELLLILFFNDLIGINLSLVTFLTGRNFVYLLVFVVVMAGVNGFYPALYLSRSKIISALKGKSETAGNIITLRRALVVFQFFLAALMVVSMLTALEQVNVLRNRDIGFEKDPLLVVRMVDRFSTGNYERLKTALLQSKYFESACISSEVPGGNMFHGMDINGKGIPRNTVSMKSLGVDEDFLRTYDIHLISGRAFDPANPRDQREAFILNEAAAKLLGWSVDECIGKAFEFTVYIDKPDLRQGAVIGVVNDFNFESLHRKVEPLVIYINKHSYYADFLSVKLASAAAIPKAVDELQNAWNKFNPDKPVDFFFLDKRLQQLYTGEAKLSSIFSAFAVVALLISCLGVFGLAAFSTEQRLKEISLRKILGASGTQLWGILSKEYLVLIVTGNLLAWPLAFYLCDEWLSSFAYRTQWSPAYFGLGLLVCAAVALLPISYQSQKAIRVNPVETLKMGG